MIFLRYENWKSYLRFYPVTCLILAANIIMFVIGLFDRSVIYTFILTNMEPFASEYWRLVSSMFLHGDFMHLLSNGFAILVFAPPLERLLGHWRYLLLYLGSGVIGNIISLEVYRQSMEPQFSLGASGAIYGVYGAFLYIALFQRNMMDESSRKTLYSILMVGIVFSLMVARINWIAHFGGLIGGFFLYGLIIRLLKRR